MICCAYFQMSGTLIKEVGNLFYFSSVTFLIDSMTVIFVIIVLLVS